MLTSSYQPAPGRFLVSEPFMEDQNFQRTVILMVEHGETGSLGFVLNRQLNMKIHEVVKGISEIDSPVFLGGPVEQNTLHYVHRIGERVIGCHPVEQGVWWGGSFEVLKHLLESGEASARDVLFFIGYSGWSPGQLTEEIERKSWIVAPEDIDFIFREDYDDIWRQVLQHMGDKYKVISNYPVDPSLN